MRYPVAIEPGNETQAFGVVIPDLPGCFSAGDSLEEAMRSAPAAIAAWIDVTRAAGQPISSPSSVDVLKTLHPDLADWVWAEVNVA